MQKREASDCETAALLESTKAFVSRGERQGYRRLWCNSLDAWTGEGVRGKGELGAPTKWGLGEGGKGKDFITVVIYLKLEFELIAYDSNP